MNTPKTQCRFLNVIMIFHCKWASKAALMSRQCNIHLSNILQKDFLKFAKYCKILTLPLVSPIMPNIPFLTILKDAKNYF